MIMMMIIITIIIIIIIKVNTLIRIYEVKSCLN